MLSRFRSNGCAAVSEKRRSMHGGVVSACRNTESCSEYNLLLSDFYSDCPLYDNSAILHAGQQYFGK